MTGRGRSRDQQREIYEWSRVLLASPGFRELLAADGAGPTLHLECARGHRLLPIRCMVRDSDFALEVLPDLRVRRTGPVAHPDEPWTLSGGTRGRCLRFDCDRAVSAYGYCEEHGGPLEELGQLRTRFICHRHRCGWTAPVTTLKLLQTYAVATRTRQKSIRLGDAPAQ